MKISGISNVYSAQKNQNFNGILKLRERSSYDDNAQETTVYQLYYDYYPYKNETPEEMKKTLDKLSEPEYEKAPYPAWNTYTSKIISVQNPISMTKEDFDGEDYVIINNTKKMNFNI